jgi:chromate transporter
MTSSPIPAPNDPPTTSPAPAADPAPESTAAPPSLATPSPVTPSPVTQSLVTPSLADLFIAFAKISLSGFGGVLAWARRMMVDERKWMTPDQFNEVYALCSFLPGGNIINFSVIFGGRFRGPLGSAAALAGLLGPPMILILIIGAIYAHYGDLPELRRALTGVASAAAGLMMATVAKMLQPLFRNRGVVGPLIAVATFVAIAVMHWPLPLVLLVIVPVSIAYAWTKA